MLQPVAALAKKFNVAVLVVSHRRKSGGGKSADLAALGSIGFVGISRSVWHLFLDSENPNRRKLLPGKMNLCKQPTGLAFSIEGGHQPRIVWEAEELSISADEEEVNQQESPGPKPEKRQECEDWLDGFLITPRGATEVFANAAALGYSHSTVTRSSSKVKKKQTRQGWIWERDIPQKTTQNVNPECQPPN